MLAAITAVIDKAGASAVEVERFVHGMTVGTNALLEERGARTALVTTTGFEDVLEIGRQDRPELYRLCAPKPRPSWRRATASASGGRIGPGRRGRSRLPDDEPSGSPPPSRDLDAESVAICLLFSYVDAVAREAHRGSAIRERLPELHVSASHEVLPRFREYERTSTTVVDAYLSPLLGRYLSRLAEASSRRGLPEPEIMRSSGGVAPWREAARPRRLERPLRARRAAPSAPGSWRALSGDGDAVGLDMGGTSCDVCVIEDGTRADHRVAGDRRAA